MKTIEKRDFIHSHLNQIDEHAIDELFEKLNAFIHEKSELRVKLVSRAKKSEKEIRSGKVFSRKEIEQKTKNVGKK